MNWSNISRREGKTWESFLPSLELMKTSLLHLRPQVALTCLALVTWFWGPVITQHSTRTRRYRSVARLASSASQGTTLLTSNLNSDEHPIVLLKSNPISECGSGRPRMPIREIRNGVLKIKKRRNSVFCIPYCQNIKSRMRQCQFELSVNNEQLCEAEQVFLPFSGGECSSTSCSSGDTPSSA